VTYALVGALLVVGALDQELWPLSAFRLFSGLRTGQEVGWEVVAVDQERHLRSVPLSSAPGLRGSHHLLPTLRSRSPSARRRALARYIEGAGMAQRDLQAVRVYRVVRRTPTDGRGPGEVVTRRLELEVPW